MRINADFQQRAVVHAGELDWVASPMPGVERRMLDRVGDEVARATSLVRYAPGSAFSAHRHELGEEFLVLAGFFQDESGDFPAGTYVRNPPGSEHVPASETGCTIFVKLRQFHPDDCGQVSVFPVDIATHMTPTRPGVTAATLHADNREQVRIEHWEADTAVRLKAEGGIELLLLEGDCIESGEALSKHSWLRLPPGEPLAATAGANGCRVWIKSGGLADVV